MTYHPQSKGGKARAAALPPERRSEIAKAAATARWHGYIDQQTGRFIRPANVAPPPPAPSTGLDLDPLLLALLRMITPTADGWPRDQRVRWFRTFAMNVSQVYDKPEEAVDLKIDPVTSS